MAAPKNLVENIEELKVILLDMRRLSLKNDDVFDGAFAEAADKHLRDLNLIFQRLKDASFRIGIIGEFSSGKSTFINAFLEKRYLVEDIVQGTTCCETRIVYASEDNVKVIRNDGATRGLNNRAAKRVKSCGKYAVKFKRTYQTGPQDKEKEIIDFIREATADETAARNIAQVIWQSPIEVLKDDLILVDTPGLGSLNERHTNVARKAAANCDGLLVLTPLHKPLSAELIREVQSIAGEKAPGYIFVGTFADKLPEREAPRMKQFFQTKLQKTFSHACPFYFVSAYEALKELENEANEKQQNVCLARFRQFRKDICRFLGANRELIQSGRLSHLISRLLDNIDKDLKLNEKIEASQQKSARLKEYRLSFNPDAWINKFNSQFMRNAQAIKYQQNNFVDQFLGRLLNNIYTCIWSCKDEAGLKYYLENGIKATIAANNNILQEYMSNYMLEPLAREANNALMDFDQAIREEYQILSAEFGSAPMTIYKNEGAAKINRLDIDNDSQKILDDLPDNEAAGIFGGIGGGLAVGIAMGIMLPGIGFLLGGAIALLSGALGGVFGGILGSLFSDLNDTKRKACEKITEIINGQRMFINDQINNKFNEIYNTILEKFSRALAARKRHYNDIISRYNDKLTADTERLKDLGELMRDYQTRFLRIKKECDQIHANIANNLGKGELQNEGKRQVQFA